MGCIEIIWYFGASGFHSIDEHKKGVPAIMPILIEVIIVAAIFGLLYALLQFSIR